MPAELSGSLVSLVAQSAREFGDRPALARASGSETVSYPELWERVQRGAQALRSSGVNPGERILLFAESGPDWPVAFFSILHGGHVAVPVTSDTAPAALDVIAAHAEASSVLVSEGTESAAAGLAGLRRLDVRELSRPGPVVDLGSSKTTLAVLAFTSGSTGHPLAVQLTHANLLGDLEALLRVRRAGPADIFLSMLPPAHLFELMGGLLGPLVCGAKIVYPGRPLPNRLVDSLREDRITHACCVPGLLNCLYQEVLDELAENRLIEPERRTQPVVETARRFQSELDPASLGRIIRGVRSRIGSSLKTLVLGGAALDPAWACILVALGIRAEIGYGLTEASPIVSLGWAGESPPGSVGRPLPGVEVRIAPSGEIQVRGPNVTPGYHRDPASTRAALVDGWLRTGDQGRLDAEGFLFVTGRLKEAMVTEAGETIYPEEVEPYYASPCFSEWCVAGRPGPQGNDLPTLFVVPAKPHASEVADVFERLRAAAPARFRLDKMVCLDHPLPRTALGKPKRRAVVAQWRNQIEHHA